MCPLLIADSTIATVLATTVKASIYSSPLIRALAAGNHRYVASYVTATVYYSSIIA